ncbi:MAG: hypothetical protein U0790_04455 [Isosphaeraceae bacterium]
MWVEQAIFTSLPRRGREGYHLVGRSSSIEEVDARAITRWCPSHGGLLLDAHNRASVNFHPLPSGRFALSRSCEGPPEYSGRGGCQVYTHILILDDRALQAAGGQPFDIYRNALALGYLFHQFNPPRSLEPLELPTFHVRRDRRSWGGLARDLGLPPIEPWRERLMAGRIARIGYDGDRALLAECLIGSLPPEAVRRVSFASSLQPSVVRPFVLSLVDTSMTQGSAR